MNVVGRVGSLISQGVYSVATPFHPFGGAVDIIVVEQQDGTYRSTPWYVCFGKFQGVLKGAEKMVTISVNGVEANFRMFLDNSGKAYFMRELASGSEELDLVEPSTPESNRAGNIEDSADDQRNMVDENLGDGENIDQPYELLGEQSSPQSSSGYHAYQYGSLNEVEDLVKSSDDPTAEMVLISVDGHVLTAPFSSNQENTDSVQLDTPQFHLGPGEGSGEAFGASGDVWGVDYFGDLGETVEKDMDVPGKDMDATELQSEDLHARGEVKINTKEVQTTVNNDIAGSTGNAISGLSKEDTFKSCLDFTVHAGYADSHDAESASKELGPVAAFDCLQGDSCSSKILTEEHVMARVDYNYTNDVLEPASIDAGDIESKEHIYSKCEDGQVTADKGVHSYDQPCCNSLPSNNITSEIPEEKILNAENTSNVASGNCPSDSLTHDLKVLGNVPGRLPSEKEYMYKDTPMRSTHVLGFEISLCGNLLRPAMGRTSAEEAFEAHRISEEVFKESGPSIIKNGNLIVRFEERYFHWDKVAHILVGKAVFGSHFSVEPNDSIPVEHEETPKAGGSDRISLSYSRTWRLWSIPFRRGRTLQHSDSNSSNEELFVDSISGFQNPSAEQVSSSNRNQSPRKQYLRTNIPTTEQIASLNLKEGMNKIAFSFSTRVFGKQEVDAHIYLWKWNARIVISDVDGTITKSDVLGQFMPLVGKDWTQSGVAHLFSAIKENGYQLLFLSARAIVQAYLTRSFLLNLKQDGKALPSGPVVISPDGLFPSLYREVIRRAPHEFKIACLEDIKALFPSDYNPFYAGFGNRDTDELSYRKIGIPKGKIFIINPKGEVAINNCIDVKSYTSLHTLVNDMFPPTSSVEQEDYNSWNYWRMPLPSVV